MATITSAVGAAGNFSTGAAWVGGVAPTAADDAVLQATTTSMTIDAGSVCRSLTTTLFTGTLTHTAGVTLTIGDGTAGAGNVALAFGTFTYTLGNAATSAISFISTSATQQTVNFNGKTTGNVTFNAASNGSWKLTGGHTIGTTGTMTLTKGTLDVNGQTVSWGKFDMNNTNTKSLTLGTADVSITAGGFADDWFYASTGSTLSAASSTIRMTGNNSQFRSQGGTYGTVIFTGSGTNKISDGSAGQSFTTLTITGTANKTDQFNVGANITVSGTFTVNSQSAVNRVLINTPTLGTTKTITAATVVLGNIVDFQDITGAGAATWTIAGTGATDIGDCGGNSGITFSTPVTQTWSGTSGGNWSANAWTTRVPLPQDNVVISSAFSGSPTIATDMPRLGKNLDFTGSTNTFTFNPTNCSLFGSLTLTSGMTLSGAGNFIFAGRSSYAITSAGKQFGCQILVQCPSGTYTLNDAFSTSQNFLLNNGTFDSNDFSVTCLAFSSVSGTATRALTMRASTWTLSSTAATTVWDQSTTTGLTFSGSSSTILINGASANTRTFAGGGLTHGSLTYTVAGSTGQLSITGSNSFSAINFSDASNARSLKFTAGTTTTIRNASGFNVRGTSTKLMTVDSLTAATHTLSSTGLQSCDYLSVTNSIATGGGAWYAGANSTNVSGNTGWTFTAFTGISGTGFSDLEYGAYASVTGLSGIPLSMQKLSFYNSQTGSNYYSVMEAEIAFLKNKTTLYTEQSLETLWRSYIISKGIPNQGTLQDMKMNLFKAGGFS